MAYLLMIVEPRGQREARTAAEGQAAHDAMTRFAGDLAERGVLRAAESLRPDKHGVRVQIRDGDTRLHDGPFTEAREMVGGFFLLECETREDALAIAAQCPAARWASVEVREVAPCNAL